MNRPHQNLPPLYAQTTDAPPAQQINAPDLDFISNDMRQHEFEQAVRHSDKVRVLKIFFPVLGALIIIGILAALIIRALLTPDLDISNISITDGKLVMENPKLNGFDGEQRPYNLTANKAVQDASNPSRVELEKILAELPIDEKVSATITAGNGVYDAEAKTLLLGDQVHVETNDGIKIDLEYADVDIRNGTLKTSSPIFASSPQADISAGSLVVEDEGTRIIFDKNVRMTLRPAQVNNDESPNDQN